MKITICFSILWNVLIFVLTPVMLHFYVIAEETKRLILILVLLHNIFSAVAFPFADPLGKGLRAAGDVTFTMVISIATTVGARLVFSILFGIIFAWGVIGIAVAMCLDWCIRAVVFYFRFRRGTWKNFRLI